MARGWHGRRELRAFARSGDGSQLGKSLRPVLGDHRLAGKSPKGSRQPGRGNSNSGPPPDMVPGGACAGGLTCGSLAPVVTARARCSPLPAGSACTHRVPAGSGPVRSRTPPALRSSATRDRSAGRARQGRCRRRVAQPAMVPNVAHANIQEHHRKRPWMTRGAAGTWPVHSSQPMPGPAACPTRVQPP
jgi:hypothetical protein